MATNFDVRAGQDDAAVDENTAAAAGVFDPAQDEPDLHDNAAQALDEASGEWLTLHSRLAEAAVSLPSLSIANAQKVEGDDGTVQLNFTVTLLGAATGPVTVRYATANGTALAGSDYLAKSGTLTFAPGETSKILRVTVNGDALAEANETLKLHLSNASGATIHDGEAIGTIRDNDVAVTLPTLAIANAQKVEGDDGTVQLNFTVTLSEAATSAVTVRYATADGTAIAGSDYDAKSGTLTFAPGETSKVLRVTVTDDMLAEANETLAVKLSNASGATIHDGEAIGTIRDNDVAAPPSGDGEIAYTVTDNWTSGFVAAMTIKPDAALDGWTVEFDASFDITSIWNAEIVSHVGDHYVIRNVEWNGTVGANGEVTFGFQAGPGTDTAATGLELNGTPVGGPEPELPALAVADARIVEGDDGLTRLAFTVTLSDAASGPVTVHYATADGTARAGSDYEASTGTLTFAAGETSKIVEVVVKADAVVEPDETLLLNLTNATGATLADSQARGTIVNDDEGPRLPEIAVGDASVTEGGAAEPGRLLFTLTLSEAASGPVTVRYHTVDGTAVAGEDYRPASGTLTFAAGQTTATIEVPVIGDGVAESHEWFSLGLDNPVGATLADGEAQATIRNDDGGGSGGDTSPVIAAYYSNWSVYGRQNFVSDVPADQLTHLFYAFAKIEDGKIALFDPWADVQMAFTAGQSVNGKPDMAGTGILGNFNQLAQLKELHPDLNIMMSVGGWTLSGEFSDVAATQQGRETFAASAVAFLKTYTMFDGLDFDWEYPGGGGLDGNGVRPEDGQNYALLLKEVRAQLDQLENETGRDYEMAVAAPAGADKIVNFNAAGLAESIDFFNIMGYDFHGEWENKTGHLAPIYDTVGGNYALSDAIQMYLDAGIDPDQLVLGAPAYGRGWMNVSDGGDGGWDAAATPDPYGTSDADYIVDYFDLLARLQQPDSGWKLYWDDEAQAAYVFNPSQGKWSSIETPGTIALKAEWAQDLGLRGMMFWDSPGDSQDPKLSLINAAHQSWLQGKSFADIVAQSGLDPDVILGGNGKFDSIVPHDDPQPRLAMMSDDLLGGSLFFVENSDAGFTADVTIRNGGGPDGVLEVHTPYDIANVENGRIVAHVDDRYIIESTASAVGADDNMRFQLTGHERFDGAHFDLLI